MDQIGGYGNTRYNNGWRLLGVIQKEHLCTMLCVYTHLFVGSYRFELLREATLFLLTSFLVFYCSYLALLPWQTDSFHRSDGGRENEKIETLRSSCCYLILLWRVCNANTTYPSRRTF